MHAQVAICARHPSASDACRELIERATDLWAKADGGGYRDDITCIVVFLPVLDKLAAHEPPVAAAPEHTRSAPPGADAVEEVTVASQMA